ncbi:hypothetical protein OAN307_c18410 [Octadecabacter antarcticus 307]|uniref:Uncharacterized protein n=1 Tax=Octadecabacter antarcticus 307 TaxID=391626 RepID=M9R5M3_9RHOB|nr:hypothetical protein [Octadecabacter antarcticus]AGI67497.1 hypothetical protein OAN307_c18410 [Octadecabacter antarcticus 307]
MDNLVDLNGLDRADDAEVEAVKWLVAGLFGDFDPNVEIEGVYFGKLRYPHTVYLSATDRFLVAISRPSCRNVRNAAFVGNGLNCPPSLPAHCRHWPMVRDAAVRPVEGDIRREHKILS